jgi:hypothetical protein
MVNNLKQVTWQTNNIRKSSSLQAKTAITVKSHIGEKTGAEQL